MTARFYIYVCAGMFLLLSVASGDRRTEEGYPSGFLSVSNELGKYQTDEEKYGARDCWKNKEFCYVYQIKRNDRKKFKAGVEELNKREYNRHRILRFLRSCPESTKPATIARNQLKYLYFVVQGNGRSRRKYTYWEAKNITNDPRIDFRRKTVVVALGYLDSTSFPISAMFANEYEHLDYNVILVDNQRFATVHYYLASRLMRPVGKHVAEVLVLLSRAGLDPKSTELLGFSLGGQTVSYIAKNYQDMTGRNISRITALEPAGPCFRTLNYKDRLDKSDADFVQVIHTNIDGFGMATRMGHFDVYINGGEFQPNDLNFFPCTSTCSHFRVLTIWLAAMRNPDKFIAIKCENIQEARDSACYNKVSLVTNVMGVNVDVTKQGVFYLATDKRYPYYLGWNGIKSENCAWHKVSNINEDSEIDVYT